MSEEKAPSSGKMQWIDGPHPTHLSDERFKKQCEFVFGRSAGPGGQHRNKVETAVTARHVPTGVEGRATERRKQYENRRMAIRRLRMRLAMRVRTRIDVRNYQPSALWKSRRQGRTVSINPKHADYPGLLAEVLDVIVACDWDVANAAQVLGITMSQVSKLLRHEGPALAMVNDVRTERGWPPLR